MGAFTLTGMKTSARLRFATADLWTLALDLVGRLAPVLVGARVLDGDVWRRAATWLRDLEALARRVLLAQAVLLSKAMKTPKRTAWPIVAFKPRNGMARPRLRFRIGLAALPRLPNPWREPRARPDARRDDGEDLRDAAPLQRRLAALQDVIDAPDPHAMRLARRLARRRHMLPDIVHRQRRVRPCVELRPELSAIFREPFEHLVARCAPARERADPERSTTENVAKENVRDARRGRLSE